MSQFVGCREACGKSIIKMYRYGKSLANDADVAVSDLNAQLTLLTDKWSDYRRYQEEVLKVSGKETIDSEVDIGLQMEDIYANALSLLMGKKNHLMLNQSQSRPNAPQQVTHEFTNVQLPTIKLPTFNGSYDEWGQFKDLFNSLILHNVKLSDSQKLHYLKSSISGEAAQLLNAYAITDSNLQLAWSALVNRFENIRSLTNNYLQKIVDAPNMRKDSSSELRKLIDDAQANINQLKALKYPTDNWDAILTFLIVRKLDSDTRRQWELQVTSNEYPKWDDFTIFLYNRCRSLELLDNDTNATVSSAKVYQQKGPRRAIKSLISNTQHQVNTCNLCNKGFHYLHKCPKFYSFNVTERRRYISQNNQCSNCLRNHLVDACKSMWNCSICREKHHTLLHCDTNNISHLNTVAENTELNACTSNHVFSNNSQFVLLATAIICIRNEFGITERVRALIDQGSQCSFVTEALVQRLSLKKRKTTMSVKGIGATNSETAGHFVNFDFTGIIPNSKNYNCSAIVMKKITCDQPSIKVSKFNLNGLQGLPLADPSFHIPSRIDVLLGADMFGIILMEGLKAINAIGLIAQSTTLGWILSGPICSTEQDKRSPEKPRNVVQSFSTNVTSADINNTLRKFWELDDIQISHPPMSEEEDLCEQHFISTFSRNSHGRYVVSLPLKENISELGGSRHHALSRLYQIERRLEKQNEIKKSYNDFMKEYQSLGHMIQLDHKEELAASSSYYIPHHHVIKDTSSTTKLRVVFDASCTSTTGRSLNDCLMVGPKIQQDIVQILLRWRTHRIAFTADIQQMYRQILVNSSDTRYQRILYRFSSTETVKSFKLLTLTYGTSCAPFLAVRCLKQLSIDESQKFPIACNILHRDFYMDDLMSGCDSVPEALHTQSDLITILESGQFHLRKWSSNSSALLTSVPVEDRESKHQLNINLDESVKALGLVWNPKEDEFKFNVNFQYTNCEPTKRTMLSDASRFFDPIGWLAPVLIRLKIQLQQLWLAGVSWDEKLPDNLRQGWLSLQDQLQDISMIRIPRWIGFHSFDAFELHGFCDASNDAYAAVVFSRACISNVIVTNFIISKTRVSPIKTISIPRLELCAALLLAKLVKKVTSSLEIKPTKITAWTDSKIVLDWLKSHPCKWKTFVANRTTIILDNLNADQWHHVPSAENPADCATRGLTPLELKTHLLWWHGPPWLKLPDHHWKFCVPKNTSTEEELRNTVRIHTTTALCQWQIFDKFSTLERLQRVTVYVLRFTKSLKTNYANKPTTNITTIEIKEAMIVLIRNLQKGTFSFEYTQLIDFKSVTGRISSLNPFVDANGLLRVGGRLENAILTYDQKHPIILPTSHKFTLLLIEQAHRITLHGGPQLVLHYLRQRYWIINAKRIVRQVINKCLTCFRCRVKGRSQLMGQLPSSRVTPSRPFSSTGLDFAGPIIIKLNSLRNSRTDKAYIACLVCMAVKAIHLEVVSQLTSEAFIAAYKRFTSRRGLCKHLYSDNGTNFVGANTILLNKHKAALAMAPEIASLLANDGCEWHFIPPSSPHFGGLWEAGVKSLKTHLVRIMGDKSLTFEELATLVSQIEAVLNSRPLCAATNDADDTVALTPGHFLVGEKLTSVPEPNITNLSCNRRWTMVQLLYQQFWRQWSTNYLHRLQNRPKWWKVEDNLRVGQLVIMIQDNMPPSKWLLGRIIKTHPGNDGLVRVVTVKCARGEFKRPIVKLCALPFSDDPSK